MKSSCGANLAGWIFEKFFLLISVVLSLKFIFLPSFCFLNLLFEIHLSAPSFYAWTVQAPFIPTCHVLGSLLLGPPKEQLPFHGKTLRKRVKTGVATRATIYRSLRALQVQNPQKSLKKSFFGGWQKKVPKNTRNCQKLPEV